MKFIVTAEFDGYEEHSELKNFAHLDDILLAHYEAKDMIRSRLK